MSFACAIALSDIAALSPPSSSLPFTSSSSAPSTGSAVSADCYANACSTSGATINSNESNTCPLLGQ
jgi:hypothetical protein